MDAQFWINAWNEGRTNFHQANFHPKLIEYFPKLFPQPGEKVLVPLCGKAKDLLWLAKLGLEVHGVELYQKVVEEFFTENELLPVEKSKDKSLLNFKYKNITVSSGDFFKLGKVGAYDLIYDRASLVALPREMRISYAKVVTDALKIGGRYLLVAYEYDQAELEGPPFNVPEAEIRALYENNFSIQLLERQRPANEGRLGALKIINQVVYELRKTR